MTNVDCLTTNSDELRLWARGIEIHPVRRAREIFPERPAGFVRAARMYMHYAYNKATAMECRARGTIETAQSYEKICDSIYERMPAFARW